MIKRYLLVALGSVSLVMGIIGIVVPVLPTTPFLLLTAFCYIRSSQRLYCWLISNRIFGPYIYRYTKYRAIDRKTRTVSLISLWSMLLISAYIVPSLHIRLFLAVVGVGVSTHLFLLKTMPSVAAEDLKKEIAAAIVNMNHER